MCCGIYDVVYIGVDWNFEKKVAGHYCRIRLDRALVITSWSTMFPFASLWHVVIAKSVHSPIVVFNDYGHCK